MYGMETHFVYHEVGNLFFLSYLDDLHAIEPCHDSGSHWPHYRGLHSVLGQSCEIHGGKSGMGTSSPFSIIAPLLHSHLHTHVTLSRKTNGQSLQNCHKAMLFWRSGSTGYKITFSVL
jgi:hypothetical protein